MKPNPLTDVLQFLTTDSWTTGVYLLLIVGSIAVAVYAWASIESQRTPRHVSN